MFLSLLFLTYYLSLTGISLLDSKQVSEYTEVTEAHH